MLEASEYNTQFLCGQGIRVGEDEYITDSHYRRFISKDQLDGFKSNDVVFI